MTRRKIGIRAILLGTPSDRFGALIDCFRWAKKRGHKRIALLVCQFIQRSFAVHISVGATIGERFTAPHPVAIVIGEGVCIEDDVTIYQGVTLGASRVGGAARGDYPKISSGSTIFAGAVVLGRVNLGANCIVGANSVVNRDVPAWHVAVGVPAKCHPQVSSKSQET